MGHVFCNLPRDSEIGLGDIEQQLNAADSSSESLNVNINDLCRAMSAGLGALQLKAQPIYRSATLEPINLYHKVQQIPNADEEMFDVCYLSTSHSGGTRNVGHVHH